MPTAVAAPTCWERRGGRLRCVAAHMGIGSPGKLASRAGTLWARRGVFTLDRRTLREHAFWFQVRDLDGARVLLRTSMARGLEGSRECQQFAADLAAYFSDSRGAGGEDDDDDYVEIMFTDSRHVAKRGSRVGQMKDNKKLGIVRGRPAAVAEVARAAQDSCVIPVWKPRNRRRGRAQ